MMRFDEDYISDGESSEDECAPPNDDDFDYE